VLLIGLLATEVMTGGARGLFYGGGFAQLGKQSLGALVVGAYAFAVSYVLAKLIDRFMGFRVSAEDETNRRRFHSARRDRVRGGSARVSAVAPSHLVRRPRCARSATRDGRRRLNHSAT